MQDISYIQDRHKDRNKVSVKFKKEKKETIVYKLGKGQMLKYSKILALSKKRLNCQVILHFDKLIMKNVTSKVSIRRIVKEFLTTKQKRRGGKK